VDLTAVAEELYGLRPEQFVARRNTLAKEARGSGDEELSAEVRRLAKPSTAAWVVNMLVRHRSERLEEVLEMGAALREAQASMAGDELRRLGRQRRRLIAAVTREARSLAHELGDEVGEAIADQVEATLHAAMVDPAAAEAVRTGFLVKPLAVAGTEAAAVTAAVALPGALTGTVVRRTPPRKAADERPELTVVEDSGRATEEAAAGLRRAEQQLATAERKREKADRRLQRREARALQLRAELDELRRKVAELEQRLEDNEDELSEAAARCEQREEALDQARHRMEGARKAMERARNGATAAKASKSPGTRRAR
jgi:hypothetical protein